MYPVNQDYKDAVYAPSRSITARVLFDISDVTAEGDVTSIDVSPQASLSDKDQLNNDALGSTSKLATWERGRFKLDGSFSFADDVLANNEEVGYASADICDAFGVFATPISVDIYLGSNTHDSMGITVVFDPTVGEYAADFDVVGYNGVTEIERVSIVDNDKAYCPVEGAFTGYDRIQVVVYKWGIGNRRARLSEIDFGILHVYDDNTLMELSLIEEMDVTSGRLPAAEFKFRVENTDRRFNILNPTGVYAFLQQRQEITVEFGALVNGTYVYTPLGNYLLADWQSDEGALTSTFTAQTYLELMSNFDYENLTASSKTLYQLAEELFATCGITRYSLDTYLQTITTNSLSSKKTCREILHFIALAGECNVYVTRDNTIVLKRANGMGAAVDTVDFDNSYREPKIVLDRIIKTIEVSYFTDVNTSVVVSVANPGVTVGDVLRLQDNTLIDTSARATAVANWLLLQKSYRGTYDLNWRGNPAHELNDVISIENTYGANKDAIITKNELTYRGYLAGRTRAKGLT